ncbi:3-oxoacyl-ACP reductase [Umezawaea sp.]|uniref:3-oxoacyl-ACP reductase n=1 Tax=Umezawaea sp. TaxID=1955258 RepID=UPI002ED06A49
MDLAGKVAVVTGAGAGLGRAEALALARAGADVVLNDLPGAADTVVEEVERLGAKAVVVEGDVGDRATADGLLAAAVEHFGGLHVVVNNAGVLRDRMLFSTSDDDWDLVLRVHLRGHFLVSRAAATYWRARAKETGGPVYGRVVNTSSEAFLLGPAGQPNYAAAKAGIVALTLSTAQGLARYGVRANAICPRARTAMTEHVFGEGPRDGVDPLAPEHVGAFVAHLASPAADAISGQVFVVHGGVIALMAPPTVERRFDSTEDLAAHFAARDPRRTFACTETLSLS